jgi:hypothetical protein
MATSEEISAKETALESLLASLCAQILSDAGILRRELEEARLDKMGREFQIAIALQKETAADKEAQFQRLLQLRGSPQSVLLLAFYQSLRSDQKAALIELLDMPQKIMLLEIEQQGTEESIR